MSSTAIDPQLAAVRTPPHSVEAEQSVLGGLLLDNSAWDRIGDRINTEDFYRHDHRLIFQQIARLIDQNRPADTVTVRTAPVGLTVATAAAAPAPVVSEKLTISPTT